MYVLGIYIFSCSYSSYGGVQNDQEVIPFVVKSFIKTMLQRDVHAIP